MQNFAVMYVTFFRFCVFVTSWLLIILGYFLFKIFYVEWIHSKSKTGEEINIKHKNSQLTFRNASPGIVLCVLGACIVIISVIVNRPEVDSSSEQTVTDIGFSEIRKLKVRASESQRLMTLLNHYMDGVELNEEQYLEAMREMAKLVSE